ncbi:MAG TPA: SH3 domain-containing protein [Dehalococcoidia bacterium]
MFFLRTAAVALVLISVIAIACGGGGGKKPQATAVATETPATGGSGGADQAVAQYVQTSQQKPFVADCKSATPGADNGKVCATFIGERDNMRAYKIGPTFSEPTEWVIVAQANGQWTKVANTVLNADTAAVPGIPWPLKTGVDLVVAGSDPCVNVREGPGLNQKAVDCIKDGTKVRLTAGPTLADSINWWQVEGRTGWVAGDYLRYPDAAQ